MILVSHGKQRLYPKELVPLERDNSSHLQYTFYVLRILNNPLRVFIGKRDIMELYDSGASAEIIKK